MDKEKELLKKEKDLLKKPIKMKVVTMDSHPQDDFISIYSIYNSPIYNKMRLMWNSEEDETNG